MLANSNFLFNLISLKYSASPNPNSAISTSILLGISSGRQLISTSGVGLFRTPPSSRTPLATPINEIGIFNFLIGESILKSYDYTDCIKNLINNG